MARDTSILLSIASMPVVLPSTLAKKANVLQRKQDRFKPSSTSSTAHSSAAPRPTFDPGEREEPSCSPWSW